MIETEGYIKSKRLTYWERNSNVYCINKNKDLIPCDIFMGISISMCLIFNFGVFALCSYIQLQCVL